MVCLGKALVLIGKSDLDYLGIKPLGHRKMLLAGIAEIKMDQPSTASASTETVRSLVLAGAREGRGVWRHMSYRLAFVCPTINKTIIFR